MEMEMELRGFASAVGHVHTLDDLRDLVAWADRHGLDGDKEVEVFDCRILIVLADGEAEMISCGDHYPHVEKYDVILPTHTHKEEKKKEAPKYDWMSVDRYGDEARPE